MKSVILCEGRDDLWFIAYYLHKTADWTTRKDGWRNYTVAPLSSRQAVQYLKKGGDSAAVWCVGGKDSFQGAVSTIFEKFIADYPFDPIDSVVIVRDRDNDPEERILSGMRDWIPGNPVLRNKAPSAWTREIEGSAVSVKITPVVIPFSEEGAIETLLMEAVRERGREEEIIVQGANAYIDGLRENPEAGIRYLSHERLVLKARYAAVIAATNPDHSTGLFQDMVMSCPWEESAYVKEHFDVIAAAVSS
ncbi:MAG: hypothetical protein K2N78_04430 [Oscillospiraceae bacterium]|nr:hypothetical protein [Oscillospiraceae bacterium]